MDNSKTVNIFAPIQKKLFGEQLINGDELLVAEKIWKMLCWLNNEFIADCKNISISPPKNNSEFINNEEAITRNTSRTISYIIQISLLEGLILKLYKNICAVIKVRENSKGMGDRKKEMEDVTTFRNKVAAHLSFYSTYDHKTQKHDNLSTQISSLTALLCCGTDGKSKSSFGIAVMHSIVNGEKPSTQIPTIRIAKLHPKMKKHFQSWIKMFLLEIQKFKKRKSYILKS